MNGVEYQESALVRNEFADFISGRALLDSKWEVAIEMWAHGDNHSDAHGDHTDHADGTSHHDGVPGA